MPRKNTNARRHNLTPKQRRDKAAIRATRDAARLTPAQDEKLKRKIKVRIIELMDDLASGEPRRFIHARKALSTFDHTPDNPPPWLPLLESPPEGVPYETVEETRAANGIPVLPR